MVTNLEGGIKFQVLEGSMNREMRSTEDWYKQEFVMEKCQMSS